MKKVFFTLFVSLFVMSLGHAKEQIDPLSIVIVGGGPAGLATAIEAKQQGAEVLVVEQRSSYSRERFVFLFGSSIDLLKRWQVVCPEMSVCTTSSGMQVGCVVLNDLEMSLEQHAREIGIIILHGEFQNLDHKYAQITDASGPDMFIPYDILIGADGAHSRVRDILGIELSQYGHAIGAFAIMSSPSQTDFSAETFRLDAMMFRRVLTPMPWSVMFAQDLSSSMDSISSDRFVQLAKHVGWGREAQLLEEDKVLKFQDRIEVSLQQAQLFVHEEKSALLVGDAAATASFFDGRGLNTAFKAARLVGSFLSDIQEGKVDAYQAFNNGMQQITDELIKFSWYLFHDTPYPEK